MAPTRTPRFFALSIAGAAEYRRDYKPDPYTWTVLLTLLEQADWRTGIWTGRLGLLTDATGLDGRTIQKRLELLAGDDSISIVQPFGHGDNHPPAIVYVCAYSELRESIPGSRERIGGTHEGSRESIPCTHEQGTSSLHLQATPGTGVVAGSDDSEGADEPALRPASSPEPCHEAWQHARRVVAQKKARGDPIITEKGLLRWHAEHWTPGTPKSSKPSPKAPERSERLVRPQPSGSVPEEAVEEYQSLSQHMDDCGEMLEQRPGQHTRWESKQMVAAEALDKLEDEYPGIEEMAFPTK